eukprot:3790129-Heterocapsa_arctica.AAC.1
MVGVLKARSVVGDPSHGWKHDVLVVGADLGVGKQSPTFAKRLRHEVGDGEGDLREGHGHEFSEEHQECRGILVGRDDYVPARGYFPGPHHWGHVACGHAWRPALLPGSRSWRHRVLSLSS